MPKFTDRRIFWLCMTVFFVQPLQFGMWLSRLAEVQTKLELSTSELALGLLGMPLGVLPTLYFAGKLVDRLGPRRALLIAFPPMLGAGILPSLAPGLNWLFLALFVLGAVFAFSQVALNVFAANMEKSMGKAIMNRAHGFWSLGVMVGSFVGVQLAGLDFSVSRSLIFGGLCLLPLLLLAAYALPPAESDLDSVESKATSQPVPPAVFLIIFVVFGATIVEGAMIDWAAVYMHDVAKVAVGTEGLAVTVFAALVTAGRFVGDALNRRFGPVLLARAGITSAICGLLVLTSNLGPTLSFVGFGLVGLGVSSIFPLGVSASAAQSEVGQARNVSVMTFGALTGFLVGPPMIGFVGEATSLNFAFGLLIPTLIVSFYFAGRLAIVGQRQ